MRRVKHRKPYFIIALAIVTAAIYLILQPPVLVSYMEAKTFDFRMLIRGERNTGDEIVIVGIDDKSLDGLGLNVWSREYTAALINKVSGMQAAVIGIDYIYPLAEKSRGLDSIRQLREMYEALPQQDNNYLETIRIAENVTDVDQLLASAIHKAGNVVLAFAPYAGASPDVPANKLPSYMSQHALMLVKPSDAYLPIRAEKSLTPLTLLATKAASIAHVYTQYDIDGAIRWEPLYVNMEEQYFPSFGLELIRLYAGLEKQHVKAILGDRIILGGELSLPTDIAGRILINYLGKRGHFPTYSAIDVLQGRIPDEALRDRIVLLGDTALGTGDIHVTPFTELNGVEKQATVIENILNMNYFVKEEITVLFDIIAVICFAGLMAFAVPYLSAFASSMLFFLFIAAYFSLAQYAFEVHNTWFVVFVPSLALSALFLSLTTYRFFSEELKAKRVRKIFSSYTTEKVVNELIAHPEMAKLGGTRKNVTVLFSDVRSFTTFSENHTPEEVVSILNELLSTMTDVILKWDGTLDKFVGDEIMAFWGAPVDQANHAELATQCAIEMLDELHILQDRWTEAGKERLDIGVGLNTGEVVVGNIGSEAKKMDYTIIGDSVNLGARVEALTRNYNAHLIITEFTRDAIPQLVPDNDQDGPMQAGLERIEVKRLDSVQVKGKEKFVVVYELVSSNWTS